MALLLGLTGAPRAEGEVTLLGGRRLGGGGDVLHGGVVVASLKLDDLLSALILVRFNFSNPVSAFDALAEVVIAGVEFAPLALIFVRPVLRGVVGLVAQRNQRLGEVGAFFAQFVQIGHGWPPCFSVCAPCAHHETTRQPRRQRKRFPLPAGLPR